MGLVLVASLVGAVCDVRPSFGSDEREHGTSVSTESGHPPHHEKVTAAEVVDHHSLAVFVEQAAEVLRDAYLTGTFNDVRNSFRTNGDWKSDSIYVWMVNDEGMIVLHGNEQHREGTLANLDRIDIHGTKFVQELIEKGEAGGGYVLYHYDNPRIKGDEKGIKSVKLGYATSFTLPMPAFEDRSFIVGSGLYVDI